MRTIMRTEKDIMQVQVVMRCNACLYVCSEEGEKEQITKEMDCKKMEIGIQHFNQIYTETVKEAVEEAYAMVCQVLDNTM